MNKFGKKDLGFAIITGLITGLILWRILYFLRPDLFASPAWAVGFIIVIPILWILGVLLGYFLGQWFPFFNQFGKFAAIGFTNAAVDFGILNLLIAYTGHTSGRGYSIEKTASFCVALISSYVWNKYWAFDSAESRGGGREFGKFVMVTIAAFIVNVSVASLVVNYMSPVLNFSPETWANVGAVIGSAVALVVSFVGFKKAVFKN
ncbi:MAG: hypothetical protein UY20_C0007G0008 [Candidatus Yanofskybacteria bacterium GW2011_GWA1_48_10]|uniref:GtrA/DPMS transmembrane domain-containing protein n=3 Tax=Parcubacteria group TaxID=1794811 RepID=A0A0G1U6E0_9BACT|nr:MAG: hypothetical protein UY20_C0007G0008 [Candidatus Yanofskybacteria bacterium GW2011_GWA1_48_10]OGN06175.1 MAG: hypothetical protein A2669_02590 [Candidatus Yanofskybacteria bacterium RIFCSPHIGHO2_01_FULL_48_25b]OHB05458.1 MAG: hypothetical protein A3A26_01735 [Candidatus Zambryskibacteria bacterium RIFCSPLOWO2_01_FULL_47_14]